MILNLEHVKFEFAQLRVGTRDFKLNYFVGFKYEIDSLLLMFGNILIF